MTTCTILTHCLRIVPKGSIISSGSSFPFRWEVELDLNACDFLKKEDGE